jgi:hypothetical protein
MGRTYLYQTSKATTTLRCRCTALSQRVAAVSLAPRGASDSACSSRAGRAACAPSVILPIGKNEAELGQHALL